MFRAKPAPPSPTAMGGRRSSVPAAPRASFSAKPAPTSPRDASRSARRESRESAKLARRAAAEEAAARRRGCPHKTSARRRASARRLSATATTSPARRPSQVRDLEERVARERAAVERLRAKVAAPSSLDEQRTDLDAARRGIAALRDAVRARPVAAVTLAAPDSDDDLYPAGLDWVEPLLVRGEVVTNS